MTTRRTFVKNTATYGTGTLFLSHLIACKTEKKPAAPMKEMLKHLNISTDAPYKMDYLRGDIGYFTEKGGTIGWLANKDGVVVIDTQFPRQSQNLLGEINKVSTHPIDLLINTHHHGDHTAGNPVFKDLTKRILAHENSKKNQERVAMERNQEGVVLPNETFVKSKTESIGGETIKLDYYGAAHTDGDIITHFENSNVVHMGDLVFNRRFPYIDKSAGANIEGWINVLDSALSTYNKETKYIFGHSGNDHNVIGNQEDIKAFQNYLEQLLTFGQKSISAGKTLEEVKKETSIIPGAPEWKGDGIERSLDAVYQELQS